MTTANNHKQTKAATGYIRWSVIAVVLLAAGLFVHSFFKDKEAVALKTPVRVAQEKVQEPIHQEPAVQEPTEANSEIAGKYYGLCAKNSVRSVKDFQSTVEKDPVLARHFAGFDWQAAHLGKQDEEAWIYVTYRKDDVIRRTSRPVRLPKGDVYITDGTRVVRTFCCNDYVAAPPPSKAVLGPSERVDGPPRRIVDQTAGPMRKLLAQEPPPATIVGNELPPPVDKTLESFSNVKPASVLPGGSDGFTPYSSGIKPKPPTTVVPEPSTFILLLAGIAGIALLRRNAARLAARSAQAGNDLKQ